MKISKIMIMALFLQYAGCSAALFVSGPSCEKRFQRLVNELGKKESGWSIPDNRKLFLAAESDVPALPVREMHEIIRKMKQYSGIELLPWEETRAITRQFRRDGFLKICSDKWIVYCIVTADDWPVKKTGRNGMAVTVYNPDKHALVFAARDDFPSESDSRTNRLVFQAGCCLGSAALIGLLIYAFSHMNFPD